MAVGSKPTASRLRPVLIPSFVSLPTLASRLGKTLKNVTSACASEYDWWPREATKRQNRKDGFAYVKSLVLSFEEASTIALKFSRQPQLHVMDGSDLTRRAPPNIVRRPAVITLLGHRNHGKTTLLDRLCGTHLAAREDFGITQETYARVVQLKDETTDERKDDDPKARSTASAPSSSSPSSDALYTLLDTPGHASFAEMRHIGASHADLVLLIIAADEGVSDQTHECLDVVSSNKIPLIVVITKTDLPNAKVFAIKRELRQYNIHLLSPTTPTASVKGYMNVIDISAKTGHNIPLLKQTIQAVCQLIPLITDTNAIAIGNVVESWREARGRGNVIRLILKQGTLAVLDYFVSDYYHGKIKGLRDANGKNIDKATAGVPIELMGVDGLPTPGSDVIVCSKKGAEDLAEVRQAEIRFEHQDRMLRPAEIETTHPPPPETDDADEDDCESEFAGPLHVVIKTGNIGALRMIYESIDHMNAADPLNPVIHAVEANVGVVTKQDIVLAQSYACPIYCFRNDSYGKREKEQADRSHVQIIEYGHFQHFIDHLTTQVQLRQQKYEESQRERQNNQQNTATDATSITNIQNQLQIE